MKILALSSMGGWAWPDFTEDFSGCATNADAEGPFYRYDAPERDVISPGVKGERLVVTGVVLGADCRIPLANAIIDVWHASPLGKYDNSSDDFLFRGKTTTGSDGHYSFKTVLPGIYLGRPRHIHFKIHHPEYPTLTTQMYFAGDKRLETDETARKNRGSQRAIELIEAGSTWQARFDIYLA